MFFIPFFVLLIILIAIVMLKAVKIVPESQVYIVEKLGKYYQSLSSGLSFINPFFDRVSRVVSLKEQVVFLVCVCVCVSHSYDELYTKRERCNSNSALSWLSTS